MSAVSRRLLGLEAGQVVPLQEKRGVRRSSGDKEGSSVRSLRPDDAALSEERGGVLEGSALAARPSFPPR